MGITAAKLNAGYQPASSTFNCNALPLSDVNLSSLPSALFEPPFCSVESLLCLSKGLTAMPPEIKRFTRLVALDLGHNAIEAYPEELFSMTTLKRLRLGSNQLPALPSNIAVLTRLEELHLSNNPLHSLPWTLFTVTSLTLMDLRATMLNIIPHHVRITCLSLRSVHLQ